MSADAVCSPIDDHCPPTPAHCRRARLSGRARGAPHAIEGGVIFDLTAEGHFVELKRHIPGGRWLVASAVRTDHRTALDRAEEKLKKQLDRAATQYRRDRHAPSELP